MLEKTWCVYKHTNKTNGKVYIGITSKKPEQRWEGGIGYRHNEHMTNAIQKYGWDGFSHEVLLVGLSEDEALDMERKLISEYQSADRRYGYNIEAGGVKRGAYSPETLEKMRQRMLGDKNPNYGKHLSDETRRKLSECNRGERHPKWGTHHSEETRKKIGDKSRGERHYLYGGHPTDATIEKMRRNSPKCKQVLCVETGVVYRSVREASRATNINVSGICLSIKGERVKTAGGYHWQFVEEVSA